MNPASQAKIDEVLKDAKPEKLATLDTQQFTKTIAKVYAELDSTHPFADGNSRTHRTFTKQLADEAGYDLDWERFNRSAGSRDALYVARDKAVNAIALPQMQNERSMMRIVGLWAPVRTCIKSADLKLPRARAWRLSRRLGDSG